MTKYLDFMATTPMHANVKAKMLQFMGEDGIFANPSSTHEMGVEARAAVSEATQELAESLGVMPKNLIWTSGATEANNWSLFGIAKQYGRQGKHIITACTEHKSILAACDHLATMGFEVTKLNVDANGKINLQELEDAITDETILISIMAVNNETGVIQDIPEIVKLAHARGVLVHTDGVQAVGKIPVDLTAWGVDLASFSAHKIYGPKGIGALYIAPKVHLPPLFFGGGQQKDLRPGTLATHQIVGMGLAAKETCENLADKISHTKNLRDALWDKLRLLPGIALNADLAATVPHTLNFHFKQIDAGALMYALREFAMSAGSACNAASDAPSHVLTGMGITANAARRSIRLSLSYKMQLADIEYIAERFTTEVSRLDAIKATAELDS